MSSIGVWITLHLEREIYAYFENYGFDLISHAHKKKRMLENGCTSEGWKIVAELYMGNPACSGPLLLLV